MSIQSVWIHLPIYDKDGIDIGSARTRLVEFEDHQAEIAELTKRLEAAELNAARYEWLRTDRLDEIVDATRLAQGESK